MKPGSFARNWRRLLVHALWIGALALGAAGCRAPATPREVTKVLPSRTPTFTRTPNPTITPSPTAVLGGIEGIVYNSLGGTRSPAVDAEIRISEKPEMLGSTDPSGAFLLDDIEGSTYHLRASNIVGSSVEKVVAVVEGKVTYLEIDILQPALVKFMFVHVTITCNGKAAAGAQMWVAGTSQVFTANSKGELTMNNVPDENATIVVVAQPCSDIFKAPEGGTWKIQLTAPVVKKAYALPKKATLQPPDVKLEILKPLPFVPSVPLYATRVPTP